MVAEEAQLYPLVFEHHGVVQAAATTGRGERVFLKELPIDRERDHFVVAIVVK